MTKLEEKLAELGYKPYYRCYEKIVGKISIFVEPFNDPFTKIHKMYVYNDNNYIKKQEHIDNLQLAFNELQKDLEELKKYEKE